MKAGWFVLISEELDDSLSALASAIERAPRRDLSPVTRTFVRASDLLVARATTQRIRMRPSDPQPML